MFIAVPVSTWTPTDVIALMRAAQPAVAPAAPYKVTNDGIVIVLIP